jgi:hypothetical protein
MLHHHAYIVHSYEDRFQVIGFHTFDDLLRSLPCRQSCFDTHGDTLREWPHGMVLADCATQEAAHALLPEKAVRLHTMPWPDQLPSKCEAWIC